MTMVEVSTVSIVNGTAVNSTENRVASQFELKQPKLPISAFTRTNSQRVSQLGINERIGLNAPVEI